MVIKERKQNCREALELHAERVTYFKKRIQEKGLDPHGMAIVVINVDDKNGAPIAESLMPNHDWQIYRDRGEIPFALGIVYREGLDKEVAKFDKLTARKLTEAADLPILVINTGAAEVFIADIKNK